jgi:hypothetical protein
MPSPEPTHRRSDRSIRHLCHNPEEHAIADAGQLGGELLGVLRQAHHEEFVIGAYVELADVDAIAEPSGNTPVPGAGRSGLRWSERRFTA